MKTLIVQYLPRKDYSHTKKVLDAFKEGIKGDIEILDLLEDTPDLLDSARVLAYIHQNYLGEELTPENKALLSKMERYAQSVREADIVVLATPMFNFSYPAIIKAWFDSVMYKGTTWSAGDKGYYGLCTESKAVLLFASGGAYTGAAKAADHLTPIVEFSFNFMGFKEFKAINAGGINLPGSDAEKIVATAQAEARAVADSWYNS